MKGDNMKFIKETIDETTGDYIFTYEVDEEEKEKLDKFCERNNISLEDVGEYILTNALNNPDEFFKFIKENREDKLPKGTIGKPVLNYGDKAGFYITIDEKEIFCIGTVEIIDSYGTFEQNEEPSYDIMVENFNGGEPCLVKHLRESSCYKIQKEGE